LISGGLGLDVETVANAAVVQNGVRVFTTDIAPAPSRVWSAVEASRPDEFVRPIPTVDQTQSSASVTDISRFAECARRYYLSRFLRWQPAEEIRVESTDEPLRHLSGSEIGVQVHAILAGQPPDPPAAEAVELADRFFVSPLGRRVARAEVKHHEWDFQVDAGDIILRGQIDLWFEHNRDLVIVDYKTDRDITEGSVAAHSLQLQLYAVALERAIGRTPTHGILFFLRSNRQVDVDLSPIAIGGAREVVHRFRTAQKRMEFPLQIGSHCFSCEFYGNMCPASGGVNAAAAD
jgi:CRISPR/Cas system-associated exonuclease Cas4 (RecB family)